MKILRLRFKNIHSFYGAHKTIDFTESPLALTGLFIISGPTGAGKSSLLDVITLALYNEVPRFERAVSKNEIDKLGSVVNLKAAAEPRTEAYAEVEYEVKSGQFRATWSISKNRNGNWNNYRMEIAALPGGQLLEVKGLADYPRKNAELIGLSYEQFVKSIILAQGSFAEFLRADRNTRGKLLEDITGTRIYRRLGEMAFTFHRDSLDVLRLKEAEMKGLSLKSSEEVRLMQEKAEAAEKGRAEAAQEKLIWEGELILADQIDELQLKYVQLQVEKEGIQEQFRSFSEKERRLLDHETVVDFVAAITQLREKEKALQRLQEERKELLSRQEIWKKEWDELLLAGKELVKEELDAESFLTRIDAFERRVLEIEGAAREQRSQAGPVVASIQDELKNAQDDDLKVLQVREPEESLIRLERFQKENSRLISLFPGDFRAEERNRELSERLQWLSELKNALAERGRVGRDGKIRKEEREKAGKLVLEKSPELQELTDSIRERRLLIGEKTEALLAETTRKNLEQFRRELKEGEPCPLCGSAHHPYVHQYIDRLTGLGDEIEALKKELQDWEVKDKDWTTLIRAARDKISSLDLELHGLRMEYKEKDAKVKEYSVLLNLEAEPSDSGWITEQQQAIREEQERIAGWLKSVSREQVLTRLRHHFQQLADVRDTVSKLEKELKALYPGPGIQGEVKAMWSRWEKWNSNTRETARRMTENAEALSAMEEVVQKLSETLEEGLKQRQLGTVREAEAKVLSGEEYLSLKQEQKWLQEALQGITARESALLKDIQEKSVKRRYPEMAREPLSNRVEEVRGRYDFLVGALGEVRNSLAQEMENQHRFAMLEAELNALRGKHRKWELLKRYIGDASGNSFSNFAQSLTLSNLIGLANARLVNLSDRYVLDKPRNDSESLFVLDTYQGNAPRSVNTLSGGETFTISLALALALSDMASRNVRIESLFIDEGFGTLDTETLESAVSILEKLQHESRKMVGVISHRQEMKDRIPVQIQVEKGADGHSHIKVIG